MPFIFSNSGPCFFQFCQFMVKEKMGGIELEIENTKEKQREGEAHMF